MTEHVKLNIRTVNLPSPEVSTVAPIVGNPVHYLEITSAIEKHGDRRETLQLQTPFGDCRLPITSSLFKNLKLDSDAHPDFLLHRSVAMETGTAAFLVVVSGNETSDKTNEPTLEAIHHGMVLSAATLAGVGNPIDNLELTDANRDGIGEVEFTEMGAKRNFDGAHPKRSADVAGLYDTLFAAQSYMANRIGYLDILYAVNDVGNKAAEEQKKTEAAFYNQLSFGFETLKNRCRALLQNPDARKTLETANPNFFAFARAMFKKADEVLTLPKEDQDKIAELSTRSEKLMKDALAAFRWQEGKWVDTPMERSEFYSTLEEVSDPSKRRNLVEGYSAAVIGAHRQGLFPMIDQLNAIARKNGFRNYPDYYGRTIHKIMPEEFEKMVDGFHTKYGKIIADYVAELKRVGGGQPVFEWDVDFLSRKLVEEKTGGQLPQLTSAEALGIAKRWFRDLGLDLDQPPFKDKIFFDLKKRDNKYGNAFATAIDDGARAWFNTNFDPNEKISLKDLNTIIHELTHDIQFILGSEKADGNLMMGLYGTPGTWHEGSALTMGDIVYNKQWMDRYLSHLPEFKDPKVRATSADILEKQQVYDNMMVLCRALWDNNLYEDKDAQGHTVSLEERLKNWRIFTKRYMQVDSMDNTQGGYIYATPHFAGLPGYYVNYGGGRPLGVAVMEPIFEGLARGDDKQLLRGGKVFAAVLKQGARNVDAQELSFAIERAKQEIPLDSK